MVRVKIILVLLFCELLAFESFASNVLLKQSVADKWNGNIDVDVCYDLNGEVIHIPEGCTLVIGSHGGFCNGTLQGHQTRILTNCDNPFFDVDLTISGTWNIPEIYDTWFEFIDDNGFLSNGIINNIFALASDSVSNHIFFKEDRIYLFELPYKGDANLGDKVSYTINNGKKKRQYSDIFNDEYSFLRIFTIPSKTHVTVGNTIQMLPTNQGAYFVFWEYDKHDVIIDGYGTIAGDVQGHLYTSPFAGKYYYGEYGHVFCCQKCSDFTFKDITIRDAFGDCIIYRGSVFEKVNGARWASRLNMDNVKIVNGRRNGLVIAARDVSIKKCHFEGCGSDRIKGTLPKSAIDIESDKLSKYPELGSQDVVIENCSFKDNYLDLASVHNTTNSFKKMTATIKRCKFSAPIKLNSCYWIKFQNCEIKALHNTADEETSSLKCKNLVFENCTFAHLKKSVLLSAFLNDVSFYNCEY